MDFDGIGRAPVGLEDVSRYPALLAEYETARERAVFLSGQLEDLTKASNDLRQIIVD